MDCGRARVSVAAVLVTVLGTVTVAVPPVAADLGGHPGVIYRTTVSLAASPATLTVKATCPEGYRVLGGGGELLGATNQVFIQRAEPVAAENSLVVEAAERVDLPGGYLGMWSVRVIAACGPASWAPVYVTPQAAAYDSPRSKSVTVDCPDGMRMIGMGARIRGGTGAVRFDSMRRAYLDPYDADGPRDSVRARAGELPGGTFLSWSLHPVAVCVHPPPGLTIGGASSNSGDPSTSEFGESWACGNYSSVEPDSYPTAVGGGHRGDSGELNLRWFVTADNHRQGRVAASTEPQGYQGAYMALTVDLICVQPA